MMRKTIFRFRIWLLVSGAALVIAAPRQLIAQQTPFAEGQVHVVRTGETLWTLAEYYLGDPLLWPAS